MLIEKKGKKEMNSRRNACVLKFYMPFAKKVQAWDKKRGKKK